MSKRTICRGNERENGVSIAEHELEIFKGLWQGRFMVGLFIPSSVFLFLKTAVSYICYLSVDNFFPPSTFIVFELKWSI